MRYSAYLQLGVQRKTIAQNSKMLSGGALCVFLSIVRLKTSFEIAAFQKVVKIFLDITNL